MTDIVHFLVLIENEIDMHTLSAYVQHIPAMELENFLV